jgi:hypothetical protein
MVLLILVISKWHNYLIKLENLFKQMMSTTQNKLLNLNLEYHMILLPLFSQLKKLSMSMDVLILLEEMIETAKHFRKLWISSQLNFQG